MKITETTILTRANTSISWPGEGIPEDPNDPMEDRTGAYFTFTRTVSEDVLTRTTTRVYDDVEKYVTARMYSNTVTDHQYHQNMATVGITWNKTIVTTAD
jgi:hypothetical protein